MKNLVAATLVCALAAFAPALASAATFTVNTTADTTVAGGCVSEPSCSLRDAVTATNASADPENRIEIPAGNYMLSAGQLTLSGGGSVTIHGAGARSTIIDAQGGSRVFELSGGAPSLEGLTVTGGVAPIALTSFPGDGGGILVISSGAATFNQVNISGNSASLNGGGVSAPPESGKATALNFNASTISGNHVSGGALEGLGGGIYVLGNLSMTNSTVTGNSVEDPGTNQGGGILAGIDPAQLTGTNATLLNTTIAGNSVGAGGVGGGLTVDNPTAGVVTALDVKNTIVAGNTVGGAAGDCGTVLTATSANNISGDASCAFTDPGSRQNTNPLLGALANNGGPTDTLALAAGSPAIDAGTNAGCPPIDERGVARPQGTACDIGAFERQPATAPPGGNGSANLALRLKAKPKSPHPGQKLTFLLTVSNRGPAAAAGTIVKGTVPASTGKVKSPKVNGKRACKLAKAKGGKRKLTCRLGTLRPGARTKLKIIARAGGPGSKSSVRVRVRSAAADPQPKNNKAKAVARVRAIR